MITHLTKSGLSLSLYEELATVTDPAVLGGHPPASGPSLPPVVVGTGTAADDEDETGPPPPEDCDDVTEADEELLSS